MKKGIYYENKSCLRIVNTTFFGDENEAKSLRTFKYVSVFVVLKKFNLTKHR